MFHPLSSYNPTDEQVCRARTVHYYYGGAYDVETQLADRSTRQKYSSNADTHLSHLQDAVGKHPGEYVSGLLI